MEPGLPALHTGLDFGTILGEMSLVDEPAVKAETLAREFCRLMGYQGT